MCQNSLLENEQIEKCIENGMPARLIKTLQSTLRKRCANENVNKTKQQNIGNENSLSNNDVNPPAPQLYVSKCPFGHGKFTTPTTAAQLLTSPILPQPSATTTAATALINNIFDDSNNNNDSLLYERLTQISKLSTTLEKIEIIATAADKNCNAVTNSSGHFDGGNKKLSPATNKNVVYNGDILAKSIQITREFAYKMQQAIRRLQQSNKIYTLLTKTTQPAHIIAVAIVTFVLLVIWPELIDSSSSSQQSATVPIQDVPARRNVMFALITYLGTFSIHFGTQIWMTFVSGLSLYFSLPRHVFGECQQVLFPKYFAMNAALSITMLVIYAKFFINTWTLAKCVQFSSLALTGSIELLVRLYLAPPMLRLMHEKYKIEGSIGSGNEIGSLVQGDLINCPHYQRIHKAFRRLHMTVAFGNIIAMACSCLQLYNIAGQLQISIAY